MQASSSQGRAINHIESPDEEYDVIDYNEELSDDDGDQRAREGELLQRRPYPPRNLYIQAMSNLMKLSDVAEPTLPKGDVPDPVRRLVTHEYVNIISPEEVTFLRLEFFNHVRRIKEYASVNVKAIESLLAKVPAEHAVLSRLITIIWLNEELIQRESEKMEIWLQGFKNKEIIVREDTEHVDMKTGKR